MRSAGGRRGDPGRSPLPGVGALGRTAAVAAGALALLAHHTAGRGPATGVDRAVLALLPRPSGELAVALDLAARQLPRAAPAVALGTALLCLRGRRGTTAAFCLLGPVGCVLVTAALKPWVARPSLSAPGWMFPSGHVTVVAGVALTLALVLRARPGRAGVALAAVGYAALLALTAATALGTLAGRYHHPTDVLGALLVPAVVVPTVALALRLRPGVGVRPVRPRHHGP